MRGVVPSPLAPHGFQPQELQLQLLLNARDDVARVGGLAHQWHLPSPWNGRCVVELQRESSEAGWRRSLFGRCTEERIAEHDTVHLRDVLGASGEDRIGRIQRSCYVLSAGGPAEQG
jgi:hypothetical protein